MKKRIASLLLAAALCCGLFALPAQAVAATQSEMLQVLAVLGVMNGDKQGNLNLTSLLKQIPALPAHGSLRGGSFFKKKLESIPELIQGFCPERGTPCKPKQSVLNGINGTPWCCGPGGMKPWLCRHWAQMF